MAQPCRVVSELVWAEFVDQAPPHAQATKKGFSAIQREGLRYESSFVDFLRAAPKPDDAMVLAGPWIRFEDSGGIGHAQPDAILLSPRGAYIFECKLSERNRAWQQLYQLYTPLLRNLLRVPLRRVQVCRNLKGLSPNVAIATSAKELRDNCIWHWDDREFKRGQQNVRRYKKTG